MLIQSLLFREKSMDPLPVCLWAWHCGWHVMINGTYVSDWESSWSEPWYWHWHIMSECLESQEQLGSGAHTSEEGHPSAGYWGGVWPSSFGRWGASSHRMGGPGHQPSGGIGRRPSGPADRSGPSSAWPSGGFLDSETIKTRRQTLVCQIIAWQSARRGNINYKLKGEQYY